MFFTEYCVLLCHVMSFCLNKFTGVAKDRRNNVEKICEVIQMTKYCKVD